jgi:ubiquinol-cytochrome c reductase cytochrome c subunit
VTPGRARAAGAAALLGLALIGAPPAVAQGTGSSLYETNCSSCHGSSAQGTRVAPSLIGRSAADIHFMLDTGRMPAAVPNAGEIHGSPRFNDAQMTAIVRYVQSFSSHPDTSLPVVLPGNVRRGRALFAEDCAVCHGAAGDGASVGADDVAPALSSATELQVVEAVRAGPSIMPRFGRDVLSDRDAGDLARYVQWLQTQGPRAAQNRGGLTLGHVGPVAEGFVAWVFGLGILVLVARRIAALAP